VWFVQILFSAGHFKENEKEILEVLTHETARKILMIIIEQKSPRQTDIVNTVSISARSIGWHVGRLIDLKIIREIKTLNNNNKAIRDKRRDYIGKEITIHDNRKICSHAAECVKDLPSVFKLENKPWIDPSGAETEQIINAVQKCPSGALSFSIDGVEYRNPSEQRNPMVTVSKNGPFCITGGIELIGENIRFGDGASLEHYALCRCGASNNKPFCDGEHGRINFRG
jgi:uncharacterized Fe-S cluster protein YjdI